MAKKPSPMMNTKEAAEIIGRTPHTVTNMCNAGQIPAVKINGTWYINRAAFLRQLGLPEEVAANA